MKNIRKRLSLLSILLVSFFLLGAVNSVSAISTHTYTYDVGSSPCGIAIDASGNVWVANYGVNGVAGTDPGDGNVTELVGAAKGPPVLAVFRSAVPWWRKLLNA